MFNSGILDVVVGLTFIFSLFSLLSTAVNEIIEAGVKMRSIDLERGIREMLTDQKSVDAGWFRKLFSFLPRKAAPAPPAKATNDMVQQLYDHPLINSLFEGSYEAAKKTRKLPSYIPARNFALALMSIVLPAKPSTTGTPAQPSGTTGATVQTSNSIQSWPDVIRGLSDEKTREMLKNLIDTIETNTSRETPLKSLRDEISTLPEEHRLRKVLMPLVDAAGNDIVQARKNIEDWFDSSMDRVSGWYKRRVQWITLIFGLGIVILVNVDTLAIGSNLYTNAAMRDSLVAASQEYAKADSTQANLESSEVQPCTSPECRVANNLDKIRSLGLPIGWNINDLQSFPNTPGGWLTKGVGWIITAFAISLGAPFWFDLLNKIMIIRSTVRPKEKSPEEPPVNR